MKPHDDKQREAASLAAEIEECGVGLALAGPSRFGGRLLTLDEDALVVKALTAYALSHAPRITCEKCGNPTDGSKACTLHGERCIFTPSTTRRISPLRTCEHGVVYGDPCRACRAPAYGILPCPFCGGEPTRTDRAEDRRYSPTGHAWFIACMCGGYSARAHQHGHTEAEVIEKWNRRSVASATPRTTREGDLAMMVRRLAARIRLRATSGPHAVSDYAMSKTAIEFLQRLGLEGSPLRGDQPNNAADGGTQTDG